jgi:type II secretory pathway component HofQ
MNVFLELVLLVFLVSSIVGTASEPYPVFGDELKQPSHSQSDTQAKDKKKSREKSIATDQSKLKNKSKSKKKAHTKTKTQKDRKKKSHSSNKYTGERGDFVFHEADLKNVLLFFARAYKLNIVIDPTVTGKVTCRLIDVPWDQALDLILRQHGLAVVNERILKIKK